LLVYQSLLLFASLSSFSFFFFNDTATTEIYTLSLHDALPISFDPGLAFFIPQHAPPDFQRQKEQRQQEQQQISPFQDGPHRFDEDRKSTRLNSSHRTISYAVFCLKKKKKTTKLQTTINDTKLQ